MPRARQIRESQRQSLLVNLCKRISEFEEREHLNADKFAIELSISILEHLRELYKPPDDRIKLGTLNEPTKSARKARAMLESELLPRIAQFSDCQAERDFLLAQLVDQYLIQQAIGKFANDFKER